MSHDTWSAAVAVLLLLLMVHISCQGTTVSPEESILDQEEHYMTDPSVIPQQQLRLPNWQQENVCDTYQWQCRTGRQCIPEWARCDDRHRQHCFDNSDEWACDSEFKCSSTSKGNTTDVFPCEHTFCNFPGVPVCDPNQQFEYKVKIDEEIKIECKMLDKDDALKIRWEFNTYEPGIEYLESTDVVSGTSYLTVKPKSSFDFGSLRCYSYNETGTSCPCEYTIIKEIENINEGENSFFSPTQETINIIEGETLNENITCKINFRGKAHEISWWKIEEGYGEEEEGYGEDEEGYGEEEEGYGEEEEGYGEEEEGYGEDEKGYGEEEEGYGEEEEGYGEEEEGYGEDKQGQSNVPKRGLDNGRMLAKGRKVYGMLAMGTKVYDGYDEEYAEYDEYDEETHKWAEYKLFLSFSKYVNTSKVDKSQHGGVYQCRVWNPVTDVTIVQNVILNVTRTCKTMNCEYYGSYQICEEGIGGSDAVCKCKDGYLENRSDWGRKCKETCAVKICPKNSKCSVPYSYPQCQCNDGYILSNDFCYETCDIKTCGQFEKCVSLFSGYYGEQNAKGVCTCDDGYTLHRNICIDQAILNKTQDVIISYKRLMLNPVSVIQEMYQRILQDRMIIQDIYKIILSNYLSDFDEQQLSCFLDKTSKDGLAQNITYSLVPVRLMSKGLNAGKEALQKLLINGSIPVSCNDAYRNFLNKKCGKDMCNKVFTHCHSFLDDSMENWNLLMDEISMMISNWKNSIMKENRVKESIIQSLIDNHEIQKKVQKCAPSKDLVSSDLKTNLSQYRLNLKFGKLEQYIMDQLEKRVNSLKNVNMKILDVICENISHPNENCTDSDIDINISSYKPISSPEVSNWISVVTNKLQSYNQDLSVKLDECEDFEFKCGDGLCISSTFKCDGYKHCTDGLDEKEELCRRPDEISCPDGGKAVVNRDNSPFCDGKKHCADGSDETLEICSNMCTAPFLRVGGECFLVAGDKKNWYGAKQSCESKGLKLAQINTKDYASLSTEIESYWVDSYFQPAEGFTWSDTGLRINGTSDPFQPPFSNCLSLRPWRDDVNLLSRRCSDYQPYICEKETFDEAETVPLSYFGAPDGFEWIGEHLVLVPGRGTVDLSTHKNWTESLEQCQQDNFKPFVPETTQQWEDMRWLLRKYQHNLKIFIWLPAIDKHLNNSLKWYSGEDVSNEWIQYWNDAEKDEYYPGPTNPLRRASYDSHAQCLSLFQRSVSYIDCDEPRIPMICEYTGDVMEAKIPPPQKKKELVCSDTFNITDTDMYEIDFRKIRGKDGAGATSQDSDNTANYAWGYHVLTYLYWQSKKHVNLSSTPEAVWYQFPVPIRVKKFAFQSYRENFNAHYAANYGPSKYEFFGSNAANCSDQSTWETLFVDDSGTVFNNSQHVKMETLDITKEFTCYGIKAIEVPYSRYVMISGVRFWVEQDNWFRIGGESFKLIDRKLDNWYDARRICQCLGADLAQPEDPYYLWRYLLKYDMTDNYEDYFLGGSDLAKEGDWRWINGGSIDVKFEKDENENCLILNMGSLIHDIGKNLTTARCKGRYHYNTKAICERDDVQHSELKHIAFGLRGQYFVVVKKSLMWNDARSFCVNIGGDLAVPKDIKLLRNYLLKQELIFDYWIGAKAESRYNWEEMNWVNGEKVDFEIIPAEYIGERGQYLDFYVSKYPTLSERIGSPSLQYFICETRTLMPEFVSVKRQPHIFEKCDDRWRGDLKCESSECFHNDQRCDGRNNCDDGSDEKYCGENYSIYLKVGTQNYLVKEVEKTFQEAVSSCNIAGGQLAVPKNLLKLKNYLSENYSQLNYWLGGLEDSREQGKWNWLGGTPILSGWANGEPADLTRYHDCVVFNTALPHDKSLTANSCDGKMAYVCEY